MQTTVLDDLKPGQCVHGLRVNTPIRASFKRLYFCFSVLRTFKDTNPRAAHPRPVCSPRHTVGNPSCFALTMLGEALGMSANGPSTNGNTSACVHAGYPLSRAATLHAASVACVDRCYLSDTPRHAHHACPCPQRCRCNVWHNHGVVAFFQAWLHGGLVLKHIQSTSKLGVGLGRQKVLRAICMQVNHLEVCHQIGFVDHGPTRGVDQHGIRLHQRQPLLVDEVVRALVQVAMKAHDLSVADKACLLNVLAAAWLTNTRISQWMRSMDAVNG